MHSHFFLRRAAPPSRCGSFSSKTLGHGTGNSAHASRIFLKRPCCNVSLKRTAPMKCSAEAAGVSSDGRVSKVASKDEFSAALTSSDAETLTVIQVSTSRCGPCNFMYPYVVELSEEFQGANFVKIMGDENPESAALMKELGVRAVPVYQFYKGEELVDSFVGASKGKLREFIEKYI